MRDERYDEQYDGRRRARNESSARFWIGITLLILVLAGGTALLITGLRIGWERPQRDSWVLFELRAVAMDVSP